MKKNGFLRFRKLVWKIWEVQRTPHQAMRHPTLVLLRGRCEAPSALQVTLRAQLKLPAEALPPSARREIFTDVLRAVRIVDYAVIHAPQYD